MVLSRLFITILVLSLCTSVATAQDVNYGETYLIGTTWYFNQQNSTVGKLIARDALSGTHFVFTGKDEPDSELRGLDFNFYHDGGGDIAAQLENNIVHVEQERRIGYASMDLLRVEDSYRAVAFFNNSMRGAMAYDWDWGFGAFTIQYLASPIQRLPLVTKGCIDSNGWAHVVSGSHAMGQDVTFTLLFWHIEPNDDFTEWEPMNARVLESMTGLGHHVKASRESGHVGLVWQHNIVGVPPPEGWENTVAHGMNNDLYLLESEDGQEWDYDNPFNITRTIPSDHEREGHLAYGDTLRPFNDVDILYMGDVIHVVFSARGFWADPLMNEVPPVEGITVKESMIWHWDSDSDSLTLVGDGWYENEGDPSSIQSNVSRPSLGASEDGTMYCLFRKVTEDDMNLNQYCYGELVVSISEDQGITWSEPINLTGTNAQDHDEFDEYVDEAHPSLADVVDESLHLYYVLAPESDESPQHGLLSECRMTYQRVPVEDLPDVEDLELPREGFTYHNYPPLGVPDVSDQLPTSSEIVAVYPNPFNNRAEVSYNLMSTGEVQLDIFDASGQTMASQSLGIQNSGTHTVSVNASELPTGIYFVKMNLGGQVATRKMICLK
ncbi:MAG: T9SS type A sorting domain-containing protein [Calditrichaeota bacterium]|nr:T9SS type A sorting domain-containing protein [Calditrichota bacterium]